MIIFRADGNPQIGSGHIMRCLSLADAFREIGKSCAFITASGYLQSAIEGRGHECRVLHTEYTQMERELEMLLPILREKRPKLLILDSYFVTADYMNALKKEAPLVYIDDMNAFDYPADVVVNYNIFAEDIDYLPEKKYLLGPKYAPLRREFQNIGKKVIRKKAEDVLLLTGGTDLEHVVLKVLGHIKRHALPAGITLHVVLGAMNQDAEEIEKTALHFKNVQLYRNITNMSELMQQCDVAVSAAGTTLYELCACGVPTVTYILADNQIAPARAFEKKGLMSCAGDVREDKEFVEKLFSDVNMLLCDLHFRRNIGERMQNTVDGEGAWHLANTLCSMLKGGRIK